MVRFEMTMGGFRVLVNEKGVGHIAADRGFFTGPTEVREFVEISSADLREIAEKADTCKKAP
jgi:hypothetical protein